MVIRGMVDHCWSLNIYSFIYIYIYLCLPRFIILTRCSDPCQDKEDLAFTPSRSVSPKFHRNFHAFQCGRTASQSHVSPKFCVPTACEVYRAKIIGLNHILCAPWRIFSSRYHTKKGTTSLMISTLQTI